MKPLRITFLTCFLLMGMSSYSQVSVRQEAGFSVGLPQGGRWDDGIDGLLTSSSSIKINRGNLDEFEGHPYLDEDFNNGRAIFGNEKLENVLVRYNVVFEDMEIKMDGDVMVINNKEAIVFIKDKKYIFMDYERNGKQLSGYFQVVVEPKKGQDGASLLLKHYKVLRDGGKMKIGDVRPPKDELDDESAYYLSINGNLEKVEKDEDEFLGFFPDEKGEKLEDYMDEKRLKIRKEKDLAQIVGYYNQM